MDHLNDC